MATVEEIIREVREELNDKSFSAGRIIELINRGCQRIAAGAFPGFAGVMEINLPNLETTITVTTASYYSSSTPAYISLPSNYQTSKQLLSCWSSSNTRAIPVLASLSELKNRFPGLDKSGAVTHVCTVGTTLYYQRTPSTRESLVLHYFREPDTMTVGSTPSFLPDHLQVPLLKSYVLMTLPKRYTRNLGYEPKTEFMEALAELSDSVGPYANGAPQINDVLKYDYSL